MVLINAKIQINVTTEKVWDIISSLDEDPIFWKGTTSVRNLSKNGNVTTREVTLDKINKCMQTVTLFPKERISILWTQGTIIGTKDIVLTPMGNVTILEAELDYKFSGMTRLSSGKITKDLQCEVDEAVRLVKEKAEAL
ncbi:MAG: SRPBCC family protein [Nitrosotalea sp.]